MILRLVIFLFVMQLTISVQAQKDTVLLNPVTVYGLSDEKYLAGSTVLKLDSTLLTVNNSSHLGELLSFQFPIYFRNYGSGMISGISMRGTSPQHTAVLWNGININSFSLGQADFSMLPAAAFDEVKVHSGGGSSRFGSGAFGGAVLLATGSENKPILSVGEEVGSFGRYFTSVKSSFHVGELVLASSLYHLQSENNFFIKKTGKEQNHAAFLQRGFVQSAQFNFSPTKLLQLDYWLHDADREIQPTTGNSGGTDEQQDRNHRLSFSYQQNNDAGFFKAGGGFVNDKIVFNGRPSTVQRWIVFTSYQFHLANQWNIHTGVDWNHIIGKIKEYGSEPVEERVDVFLSVNGKFNRVNLSANLRKPFMTAMKPPVLPYLGAEFTLLRKSNSELITFINGSKNFRAPTFNDRYWEDLGRKDLLPEKSYATEAGLSWTYRSLKLRGATFYQLIDQWILWVPEGLIYRPLNIKKVSTRGFEGSVVQQWKVGTFSQQIGFSYQYTKATTLEAGENQESSVGKQLIYTPYHTASGSVLSRFKNWSTNIFFQHSGKRFTTDSNSNDFVLRPYLLIDFSVGRSFTKGQHTFNAQFVIKNVFNVEYQQYSARAMPGRNYNFTMRYQLNYKSSKL